MKSATLQGHAPSCFSQQMSSAARHRYLRPRPISPPQAEDLGARPSPCPQPRTTTTANRAWSMKRRSSHLSANSRTTVRESLVFGIAAPSTDGLMHVPIPSDEQRASIDW